MTAKTCPTCGKPMHHLIETDPNGTKHEYWMCPCSELPVLCDSSDIGGDDDV